MPDIKMTVQLGNGEVVTLPLQAWFIGIMSQFDEATKERVIARAKQADAEAVLYARTPGSGPIALPSMEGIRQFGNSSGC